jgi:DNA ligase-1
VFNPFIRFLRQVVRVLLVFALFLPGITATAANRPMLPQVYSGQVDVSGWLMSEKLDGVRGYWDGAQLWSKNHRRLHPPERFIRDLPPFPLEGELWAGRKRFSDSISIVSRREPHAGWLQLQFAIFDVPEASGGFRQRIRQARKWFAAHPTAYAFVIPQIPVRDRQHLQEKLQRIEALGGEGLIVRQPDAHYHSGRSAQILKVKTYEDAEAVVIEHLPGKGRNRGRLGALLVELKDGTRFRIGTGFSDAERETPPDPGTVITFQYHGLYTSGIPRFPVFLRVRADDKL